MRTAWLATSACALCVGAFGSASAAPQLTGPTYVPERLGPGVAHRALPMAWIRLAVNFAQGGSAGTSPASTLIELTVPTDKGERLLARTTFASAAELQSLSKAGRLIFADVPSELPVLIRISIRSSAGAVLCTYARSYVLHAPAEGRMTQVGRGRAIEESGYLGDFIVDQAGAEISRRIGTPYSQLGG